MIRTSLVLDYTSIRTSIANIVELPRPVRARELPGLWTGNNLERRTWLLR